MYASTLDNSLQYQMSRNTNPNPRLPPHLQQKLLESLIGASRGLGVQNLPELKNVYIANVINVLDDEWEKANQEYNKKEEAMLKVAILQGQGPQLDRVLDMIISKELSKEQGKETIQSWMEMHQQQPSENGEIISDAILKAKRIIQDAEQMAEQKKESIIKSAAEDAHNIIESAKTEKMRILDEANHNASQIVRHSLKNTHIANKNREQIRKEINCLQKKKEETVEEIAWYKGELDNILNESIKLARNSDMESQHTSATAQQRNRMNEAQSEKRWNSKHKEGTINENDEDGE